MKALRRVHTALWYGLLYLVLGVVVAECTYFLTGLVYSFFKGVSNVLFK